MQASTLGPKPRRLFQSPENQTILLVEDEPLVRDLVAGILQGQGWNLLKARHSTEALHFHGEYDGEVHLLLTDLSMPPHMNGRRLAEAIRHHRPGLPVLYMSGFVNDPDVFKEIESGQALFLPKPFSPETLVAYVRLALSRAARMR